MVVLSSPLSLIVLIIKEGEAIGTFFGYRWAGIDNEGYDTFILPMMK